ncbi:MAG: hypothetical protein HKO62_07695 [Gammaproteobacteria bacterium]|nr:hypothetical protein [Gammaproteobacteria bacterium]
MRTLIACCAGAGLMAGGATLLWQLNAIAAAALVFHAGLVAPAFTAWRDDSKRFSA